MSLFIKCNIGLPQGCKSCPFNYTDVCIASNKGIDTRAFVHLRHPDCPMVELPTPHGRLIDADRLLALVEKEVNNTCIGCEPEPDDCCAYDRFEKIISEIKTAQTIIEAEVNE